MSNVIDSDYMNTYHQGVIAALNRRQPRRSVMTSSEAHELFESVFKDGSQSGEGSTV